MMLLLSLALAQEVSPADEARAREIYENGVSLYEEGRYEDAIVAFQTAYDLSKKPGLLFNMANAYERLGKFEEALDVLNRYRVYAREDERETIERRIRNVERRIAEAPPPVGVPAPATVTVPAPVVTAPATSSTTTLPATPDPKRRGSVGGWALVGGGGVLAAAGGALAGATFVQSRAWIDEGDQESWERWRPWNNAGLVAGGVGGALLLSGVFVVTLDGATILPAPGFVSVRLAW